MSCGYACVGCGKCRGKPKELRITPACPRCGYLNEVSARVCAECGMEMPRAAGSDRLLAELAGSDSDTALDSDSEAS